MQQFSASKSNSSCSKLMSLISSWRTCFCFSISFRNILERYSWWQKTLSISKRRKSSYPNDILRACIWLKSLDKSSVFKPFSYRTLAFFPSFSLFLWLTKKWQTFSKLYQIGSKVQEKKRIWKVRWRWVRFAWSLRCGSVLSTCYEEEAEKEMILSFLFRWGSKHLSFFLAYTHLVPTTCSFFFVFWWSFVYNCNLVECSPLFFFFSLLLLLHRRENRISIVCYQYIFFSIEYFWLTLSEILFLTRSSWTHSSMLMNV